MTLVRRADRAVLSPCGVSQDRAGQEAQTVSRSFAMGGVRNPGREERPVVRESILAN